MTAPLDGRNAIVTGGSRGIGRAIALELGRQGANVLITYRSNPALALDVAAEVTALGVRCIAVEADVRDNAALEHMVEHAIEQFGSIDILVNNAGMTDDGLLLRGRRVIAVGDLRLEVLRGPTLRTLALKVDIEGVEGEGEGSEAVRIDEAPAAPRVVLGHRVRKAPALLHDDVALPAEQSPHSDGRQDEQQRDVED